MSDPKQPSKPAQPAHVRFYRCTQSHDLTLQDTSHRLAFEQWFRANRHTLTVPAAPVPAKPAQ